MTIKKDIEKILKDFNISEELGLRYKLNKAICSLFINKLEELPSKYYNYVSQEDIDQLIKGLRDER